MLLLPSLMCADFCRLGEEVDDLAAAGADGFHLDVIDGHYVKNSSLGLGDIQAVCKRSPVPCDVHLMAQDADSIFDIYTDAGVQIVYVHPETERAINSTLMHIARAGAHPGLAVNPGLSFSSIEMSLPVVDYVLVMTVNPGFAGQQFLEYVVPKIEQLAAVKDRYGFKIVIDGACSPEVCQRAAQLGVDGAVLGTSALFGKPEPYAPILHRLHESCRQF